MKRFIYEDHPKRNEFEKLYRDIQFIFNVVYVNERKSRRGKKRERNIRYNINAVKKQRSDIPHNLIRSAIIAMKNAWKDVPPGYNNVLNSESEILVRMTSKTFYKYISGPHNNDFRYEMKVKLNEVVPVIELEVIAVKSKENF